VLHLSRLYSAAIMSLPLTRALDAHRMLTVATMAAIVDVVVRIRAVVSKGLGFRVQGNGGNRRRGCARSRGGV
jgi:hypothetical protein